VFYGSIRRAGVALAGLLVAVGVLGCSGPVDGEPPLFDPNALYVNLQIDAEKDNVAGFTKIMDELKARGITATVYVTGDFAEPNGDLIQGLYNGGYEIALHGQTADEVLAGMPREEQDTLISDALRDAQGCGPCGLGHPVYGFRPQGFSQDASTYSLLDEMYFEYDSGFAAGLIYAEGHEADAEPYAMPGYEFTAVPVSTVEYGAERQVVWDVSAAVTQGYSASQFSEMLAAAVAECQQSKIPLVVIFTGWVTGDTTTYDYWGSFTGLLDDLEALSNVEFVTTRGLVQRYEAKDAQ